MLKDFHSQIYILMFDECIDLDQLLEKMMTFFSFIGIKLLLLFNYFKAHCEIQYKWHYENNIHFHIAIDTIEAHICSAKSFFVPYYIEPSHSYFKVCYKDGDYKEEYIDADKVLYYADVKEILSSIMSLYKAIFSIFQPIIKQNELDYLILIHVRNMKEDFIFSRIKDDNNSDEEYSDICESKTTRNFFLSIEYTHPDMIESLIIHLDSRYLLSGNELFSPCFVLKCLHYQSRPFEYDNRYKLNVLDSDIKQITLTSKNYIRLSEKHYEIIDLDCSCNCKKSD